MTVGYTAAGKRIVRRGMGKTESLAKARLKERVREYQAGLMPDARHYTVRHAAEDWLSYGLAGRSSKTVDKWASLCRTHVIPSLGARKVRAITATDVDRWLAEKSKVLSSRSLDDLFQCLHRVVRRAMARGYVERNVVELCEVPDGQAGRASKSLTLDQAVRLLAAAEGSQLYAYVTVSLLVGARTEELREGVPPRAAAGPAGGRGGHGPDLRHGSRGWSCGALVTPLDTPEAQRKDVHQWEMVSDLGGRYWDRTIDLFGVNAARDPVTCGASGAGARVAAPRMPVRVAGRRRCCHAVSHARRAARAPALRSPPLRPARSAHC
jgi:hypothetical protein